MLKVFAYLSKKQGLDTQGFIDYYENHHVPLVLSLAPAPPVYKRNYVDRGDELNRNEDMIDSMSSRSWRFRTGPPSTTGPPSLASTRSVWTRNDSSIGRGPGHA